MSAVLSEISPDDLQCLDDVTVHTRVEHKSVEKKITYFANLTAGRVTTILSNFAAPTKLGDVLPEPRFCCFPDHPGLVLQPDVAFIAASRATGLPAEGPINIPPDLAVEIVCATDRIYDLDEKLADYHSAGVKLVWVINPHCRSIRVHRLDHTLTELSESEMLSGEAVLPGFAVRVSDLLPAK